MRATVLLSSLLTSALLSACAGAPDRLENIGALNPFVVDHGSERTVEVTNFIGRIDISERRTFGYSEETARYATLDEGSRTLKIDRGVDAPAFDCSIYDGDVFMDDPAPEFGRVRVNAEDFADGDMASLPVIRIWGGGDNIRLVVRDSILFGTVGDISRLDVEMGNCGRLDIGDVRDMTRLAVSGDVRIDLDDTPNLSVVASDHAHVRAERVGGLTAELAQQSELRVDHVEGTAALRQTEASVARLGIVEVLDARLDQATRLYGGRLLGTARIAGEGAPRIEVERAALSDLDIKLDGRGEARIDGTTAHARLVAREASLIEVHEISETMEFDTSGKSEIRVDRDAELLSRSRIRLPLP